MANKGNEEGTTPRRVVPSSFHQSWKCTHDLRSCVECGKDFEGCSMQRKQAACSTQCWEQHFRRGENDKRARKTSKKLQPLRGDGTRWCSACESYKPLSDFSANASRCRPCAAAYQKAYRVRNLDKVRRQSAKSRRRNYSLRKYGLPRAEYEARLSGAQGCEICGGFSVNGKPLHLDHDHTTGAVRGFLCENCNRGLGMFKDDPEMLRTAAVYLEISRLSSPNNELKPSTETGAAHAVV